MRREIERERKRNQNTDEDMRNQGKMFINIRE